MFIFVHVLISVQRLTCALSTSIEEGKHHSIRLLVSPSTPFRDPKARLLSYDDQCPRRKTKCHPSNSKSPQHKTRFCCGKCAVLRHATERGRCYLEAMRCSGCVRWELLGSIHDGNPREAGKFGMYMNYSREKDRPRDPAA